MHEKTLLSKDPGFVIEQHILKYFAEGGAQRALTDRVLACLASPDQPKKVAQSLKELDATLSSALFSWSSAEAQASVRIVQNLLSGLQNGVAPEFDTSPNEMLKEVQLRLPFFVSTVVRSGDGAAESSTGQQRTLHGAAAVKQLWKGIEKQKTVTLKDLDAIGAFSYLLGAAELKLFNPRLRRQPRKLRVNVAWLAQAQLWLEPPAAAKASLLRRLAKIRSASLLRSQMLWLREGRWPESLLRKMLTRCSCESALVCSSSLDLQLKKTPKAPPTLR